MIRCKCCDTENNFQIFDIDRLGNLNSGKFEALIICNICNSSMSIRFDNVLHEKDLIKRKVILSCTDNGISMNFDASRRCAIIIGYGIVHDGIITPG